MTPQQFDQWLAHMGWSERVAAKHLGCNPVTVGTMRRGINHNTGKPKTIDRRTALACAALAAGLTPWGDEKPQNQVGNEKTD